MCNCIIFASKASPLRSVSCCAHFTFSGPARSFRHLLAVRKKYVLCTHTSFGGGATDTGRVSFFVVCMCNVSIHRWNCFVDMFFSFSFLVGRPRKRNCSYWKTKDVLFSKLLCLLSCHAFGLLEHLEANTCGTDVIPPDHFSKTHQVLKPTNAASLCSAQQQNCTVIDTGLSRYFK